MKNKNLPSPDETDTIPFDYEGAMKAIEAGMCGLYQAIGEKDGEKIWSFMSDDFKRRSLEEYNIERYQDIFDADYVPLTIGIFNETIVNAQKIEFLGRCKVVVRGPRWLKKVTFRDNTAGDIGDVGHVVQVLIEQMRKHCEGADDIIKRVKLDFDIEGNKWRWVRFRINDTDLENAILEQFQECVIRNYEFSFIEIDGKWLVDNIILLNKAPVPKDDEEE